VKLPNSQISIILICTSGTNPIEQKSKHQFTENGVMGTRKEWGKTTKKTPTPGAQISQEEEEGQR
jgi:hypothetical protein